MGGSGGLAVLGMFYMCIGSAIAGPLVAVCEWTLSGRRTNWKSFSLGIPFGLLLTGVISAVVSDVATERDVSGILTLSRAMFYLAPFSVFSYFTAGLIMRLGTLEVLNAVWGPKGST